MWNQLTEKISARRALDVTFFLLVLLHLIFIRKYGVNTPWMDEWDAIRPGNLDYTLHMDWLFASHNEHRIVLTKFLNWVQLHIDGLNYRHTMYANFFLYAGIVYILREWFLVTIWQKFIFTCFALSTLSVENFSWAFQNQFHFFILFFLLSLYSSRYFGRLWWMAPVLATIGVYSFSCGVICMASMIAYWVYQIVTDKDKIALQILRIMCGVVVLGFWGSQFQPNPGHPPMAMPWSQAFWAYFSNIVSLPLGYDHYKSLIPGAIILGLYVYFLLTLVKNKDRWVVLQRHQALVFSSLTGFACLALITASRAGFGVWQSKSSRYAEVGILILPAIILSIEKIETVFRFRPFYMKVFITVCLLFPLTDNFKFARAYRDGSFTKQQSQDCIDEYFLGKNNGDCPGYIANIADRLEYATKLGLKFTR